MVEKVYLRSKANYIEYVVMICFVYRYYNFWSCYKFSGIKLWQYAKNKNNLWITVGNLELFENSLPQNLDKIDCWSSSDAKIMSIVGV